MSTQEESVELVEKGIARRLLEIKGGRVTYHISTKKSYDYTDPEEKVRAETICFLVLEKEYSPACIRTEVPLANEDIADVVLYKDKKCTEPFLVVENKKRNAPKADKDGGQRQAFANANSLRAPYAMTDYGDESALFDLANYPSGEKIKNRMGDRRSLPKYYSQEVSFRLVAGGVEDIAPASTGAISLAIKRAHSAIWSGGKRDPLLSFDEWSKIMSAKVHDERYTKNGEPRKFQVGVCEPETAVANRIYELFSSSCKRVDSVFPEGTTINLPDNKITTVVEILQDISFLDTDADTIGAAFESFFGSVFRGELGQYFTPRPVARFTVAALRPDLEMFILDPTCGSGGFLLEALLQVWDRIEKDYKGRSEMEKRKDNFAKDNVYGVEIHAILARICKISLLLHHDGHTNIEADKSFLAQDFTKAKLREEHGFNVIIGNPPFGNKIEDGDEDQLGKVSLDDFELSKGMSKVPSEHLILERSIEMLAPGGLLGMVLPDGTLNNSGEQSNCPATRRYLFENGKVLGIVSLPDYAFRQSGATNKTSVLLYRKFTARERSIFNSLVANLPEGADKVAATLSSKNFSYKIFMAEANIIGYTPTGQRVPKNDLYNSDDRGFIAKDQSGSILGSWLDFIEDAKLPESKQAVALDAIDVWNSHDSHRIDPKFHIYKTYATDYVPEGWQAKKLGDICRRRKHMPDFDANPNAPFDVMTLSQTGVIRHREPGKGQNYPEWLGMYFADSESKWYAAHTNDLVYSGIDIWKGSVSCVDEEFDGALVTNEYPILTIVDDEIDPRFIALLFRTRHYRRAFRAVNTGHSNRRRTQWSDLAEVLVFYPSLEEQREFVRQSSAALEAKRNADAMIEAVENDLDTILQSEEEFETDSGE